MHRVGCAPDDARALVDTIGERDELVLAGVCTHLAVADEPENPYTGEQLDRFDALLAELARSGGRRRDPPRGELGRPARVPRRALRPGPHGHRDLRHRTDAPLAGRIPLHPALSFKARVSFVKTLPAGSRLSYGLRVRALRDASRIATVPVGYADGVPRNLGTRRRRGPRRGTQGPDRGHGHDGPDPARRRRRCRSRSATRSCSSVARATPRSPRPTGPTDSGPSRTRSCAGSDPRARGGSCEARSSARRRRCRRRRHRDARGCRVGTGAHVGPPDAARVRIRIDVSELTLPPGTTRKFAEPRRRDDRDARVR